MNTPYTQRTTSQTTPRAPQNPEQTESQRLHWLRPEEILFESPPPVRRHNPNGMRLPFSPENSPPPAATCKRQIHF